MWLKYDAEQAKVPKESIPANGIPANGNQTETRTQTSRIVVMDSEERDSSVPSTGLITDEERSDMRTKQTKILIRETSFRLRPKSKVKVRSNEDQRNNQKIRYTRSVAIGSSDKNRLGRQNVAGSPIT